MAKINYDYYNGIDIYNDGSIEDSLLAYYKGEVPTFDETDKTFSLVTDIRANVLNWYPFSSEDSVLEIGSGCGSITETLCQKCKQVTSIEGSKRRAEITYYRNQQYENLLVYAANFGTFSLPEKYDYVVLIGVFEYAKMFFDVENPKEYFLEKIREVLKKNGKLIIAIENRYGLKYWAGANEDHVYLPYVGLTDYDKFDVQTFGKKELRKLLERKGFVKTKFYYPFPDYKLPECIYTDDRLPNKDEIVDIPINLYGCDANFNLQKLYESLMSEDIFGFFANSFIVECGLEDATLSNITYVREIPGRLEPFKVFTVATKDKKYYKIASNNLAKKHLQEIKDICSKVEELNIPICKVNNKSEGVLEIDYCSGQTVMQKLQENLGGRDELHHLYKQLDDIKEFYRNISSERCFKDPINSDLYKLYEGETEILKISLLDGNISNIMIDSKGEYIFIDQEWYSEKELPLDFLMYYSIMHVVRIANISKGIKEKLLERYNITTDKEELFSRISEIYFRNIVDGKLRKNIEESKKYKIIGDIDAVPVCYYDTGNGFNEEQKFYGHYEVDGFDRIFRFSVPESTKVIRINPALDGEVYYYFTDVKINGKDGDIQLYNIPEWNGKKVLTNKWPYFCFECDTQDIEVRIRLVKFNDNEKSEYLKFINKMMRERL